MKFYPEAKIEDSIDLTNSRSTSGNAEISKLNIRFDKEKLENDQDLMISVTSIKYEGIGYSNTDKLFGTN